MKQLDIATIARDLASSARYYVAEAMKDRLGGVIRTTFERGLSERGMADIIELSAEPAGAVLQQDSKVSSRILFGDGQYVMSRIITPEFEGDIDDIQTTPSQFIAAVEKAVNDYVNTITSDTTHASVPALYVKVEAFRVKWMLWGYVGKSNPNYTANEKAT